HLGFAIDHFGFGLRLGIFHGRFFSRFGFEFRLLNLLLLQRQGVLHGVSFTLGLQDLHLRLRFRLFHTLSLGSFSFEFRDAHLFLLNVGLHTHLVVLLLF